MVSLQVSGRDVADAAADSAAPSRGTPTRGGADGTKESRLHLGPLHKAGTSSSLLQCHMLSQQGAMSVPPECSIAENGRV